MPSVDLSNLWGSMPLSKLVSLEYDLKAAHKRLTVMDEGGIDPVGWLRLPERITTADIRALTAAAETIQLQSEVVLVISVGGSYLGSRAIIESLRGSGYNMSKKNTPDIIYVGNSLSTRQVAETIGLIGSRKFSIIVISKSGTTLEPALSFRFFKRLLENRVGADAAKTRIFAVTDPQSGTLRAMAHSAGYQSFAIPSNVGGRYSVFTPAGLLPAAVAGVDIRELVIGARAAQKELDERSLDNPAWLYAGARHLLYQSGKKIELLAYWEPSLHYLGEWYKQLFGESEGKSGLGIFPATVQYTGDLHSLGQYVQEGERSLFETVVRFDRYYRGLTIDFSRENLDGLNYLSGKTLDEIENAAFQSVVNAHVDGGVPNIIISAGVLDERNLGSLMYFFQISCALSAILLGVNPFTQPGVEVYKDNIKKQIADNS